MFNEVALFPSQPAPPTLTQRRYRSALALNNLGIRFLEMGNFEQAADCLKGATALIKAVLLRESKNKLGGGENLVQQAMQNLTPSRQAKSSSTTGRVLFLEVLSRTQAGTLTSDDMEQGGYRATNSAIEKLLQASPSSQTAHPIRLEDNILLEEPCFWNKDEKRNSSTGDRVSSAATALSSQAAIMFHNFAIAYLCLSKQALASRKTDRSLKLRQASLRLFETAFTILMEQFGLPLPSTDPLELAWHPPSLAVSCLMLAVLNSLIPTLSEASQTENATEMYGTMIQVRSNVLSNWNMLQSYQVRDVVAAAA